MQPPVRTAHVDVLPAVALWRVLEAALHLPNQRMLPQCTTPNMEVKDCSEWRIILSFYSYSMWNEVQSVLLLTACSQGAQVCGDNVCRLESFELHCDPQTCHMLAKNGFSIIISQVIFPLPLFSPILPIFPFLPFSLSLPLPLSISPSPSLYLPLSLSPIFPLSPSSLPFPSSPSLQESQQPSRPSSWSLVGRSTSPPSSAPPLPPPSPSSPSPTA